MPPKVKTCHHPHEVSKRDGRKGASRLNYAFENAFFTKRQFVQNACSNVFFFLIGSPVTNGPSHDLVEKRREHNQKVATFLPRQRLGTSVLTPAKQE